VSIRIPASIAEATTALNGIDALLTAKQWERAAIVYAFTQPNGGGARTVPDQRQLSLREFAEKRIPGLRSPSRVSAYRKTWEAAIIDGRARPVGPGDVAELPELPWEEYFNDPAPTEVVRQSAFRAVVNDPEQFRAALRDEPKIVEALAQRVVELPSTRVVAAAKLAEPIRERETAPEPRPEPRRDFGDDLIRGINLLIPVVRAVQRGEWQPNPAEAMLLHSLGLLLDQAAQPEGRPQDDLFSQIEKYLKEEGVR
jgi:hypothetical protein